MPKNNLALAPPLLEPIDQPTLSDKALALSIRAGDSSAEHTLAERFQPQIKTIGRKLGADAALCDDLAQETLLKVILNLRDGRLKDPNKLSAYIHQTARFIYYRWKENKHSKLELRETLDDAKHTSNVEQEYVKASERQWLTEQIDKLSMQRDRELLRRFYFDHKEKCEVCVELDLSNDQFDKLIWRARQRLMKVAHV